MSRKTMPFAAQPLPSGSSARHKEMHDESLDALERSAREHWAAASTPSSSDSPPVIGSDGGRSAAGGCPPGGQEAENDEWEQAKALFGRDLTPFELAILDGRHPKELPSTSASKRTFRGGVPTPAEYVGHLANVQCERDALALYIGQVALLLFYQLNVTGPTFVSSSGLQPHEESRGEALIQQQKAVSRIVEVEFRENSLPDAEMQNATNNSARVREEGEGGAGGGKWARRGWNALLCYAEEMAKEVGHSYSRDLFRATFFPSFSPSTLENFIPIHL